MKNLIFWFQTVLFLGLSSTCFAKTSADSLKEQAPSPVLELKLQENFTQTGSGLYQARAYHVEFVKDPDQVCQGDVAYFDGLTSLIEMDAPLRAKIHFAISFAVKTASLDDMGLMSHGDYSDDTGPTTSSHLHIQFREGRKAYFGLWGNDVHSETAMDQKWHSFVFNKSSRISEIWMDGQLIAQAPTGEYLGQGDTLILGKTAFTFWMNLFRFTGYLADFKIFDQSLNPKQIQSVLKKSRCQPKTDL